MSQFIKAIEIDQTPIKMMSQWSSELAESANRESQRQQAIAKMRQEQDNLIATRQGDLIKFTVDQVKDMTKQQQDQVVKRSITTLAGALQKANNDPNLFYTLGLEGVLKNVLTYKATVEQAVNAAKEKAPQLEAAGIRKDAAENIAKEYILGIDPENPFSAADFNKYLDQEISDNPHVYFDKEGLMKEVNDRLNTEGIEVERGIISDGTGTRKLSANIKTKLPPWGSLKPLKFPNELVVSAAAVDMKPEKIGDKTKNIVTEDVYKKFVGGNPKIDASMIMSAKETVHDINDKLFKVNTASMSRKQFEAAKKANPDLKDPYDNGVIEVFKRSHLTDLLGNKYDENGFSIQGKQDYSDVMDKPAQNNTTVIMPGSKDDNTKYVDVIDQAKKSIAEEKKRVGKNFTHKQFNSLPTLVSNTMRSIIKNGFPDEVSATLSDKDYMVKEDDKGNPVVVAARDIKINDKETVKKGQLLAKIDEAANKIANGGLGQDSQQASISTVTTSGAEKAKQKQTQTITKDAFRKMSIPDRQKFITEGGKVK
jgi:hypothetical protein